jgi:hypothetical protein
MEMNKLEEVFELCEQRNIPTYTELILGLPGESLQTWKDNFWKLFRMGNHTGLTVFQAQLLENAEMNLLQKKLFKIGSQRVTDYFSGSYSNEHIEEGIDIITSTKDLPFETMLDAEIFSWYINTFHINGVSTLLSRLVNKYCEVDYSEFYEDLFEYLQTAMLCGCSAQAPSARLRGPVAGSLSMCHYVRLLLVDRGLQQFRGAGTEPVDAAEHRSRKREHAVAVHGYSGGARKRADRDHRYCRWQPHRAGDLGTRFPY